MDQLKLELKTHAGCELPALFVTGAFSRLLVVILMQYLSPTIKCCQFFQSKALDQDLYLD